MPLPIHVYNSETVSNPNSDFKTNSPNDLLDIDESIGQLAKKVRENHDLIDEYVELGRLFRKRGDYRRSFTVLRNLLVRDDLRREQQSRILVELGYNYLLSKSRDHGEAYFVQALKLNKDSLYIQDGLYQCYRQTKKFEQAAEVLRTITKKYPTRKVDLVIVLSESALQKANENQMSMAKKMLASAEDQKVDSPFLHLARAQIQTMEKQFKEAILTLESFVEKWPNSTPFALKKMEGLYYELNQYNMFSYSLTKCIQKNPQNFYAHHELGKYLIKIRQVDKALEHFEKAIDLCPFSIQSLKEIVKLYINKNDMDGVLRILESFLSALPNQKAIACPRCQGVSNNEPCPICSPVASRPIDNTSINY